MAKEEKLRIGILTDTTYTPAWAYKMLEQIKQSDYASVELLILNNTKQEKKSLWQKIAPRLKYFVAIVYLTLDQKILPGKPNAFGAKNLDDLFSDVPKLYVNPRQTKFRDYIEEEDLKKIEEYNLDLLLCRGFRILGGKILSITKYGVWSYHHGDNDFNRGRPAIFWETVENWKTSGVILQILKHELDNGIVLFKSISGNRSRFVFRNMNSVYWKSAAFFPNVLKYLYDNGFDKLLESSKRFNKEVSFYSRPLYKIPGNWKTIQLLFKHYFFIVRERIHHKIYFYQWKIGFSFKKGIENALWRYKIIDIPNNKFWADPFQLERGGKHYIYFEEVFYTKNKGNISVVEVDKKTKSVSNYKKVLEKDYHLSYPFLFEENNELFLIPETAQNKTIELYRCVEFPDQFEFVKNLMEGVHAVDTTILHHNDSYWLFCNMVVNEGASSYDELFLFYADQLDSTDWKPHPLNPIVSDVRRSRPAGRIFNRDGKLYRPSQICTPWYGYGISLHEIVTLDKENYEEREVSQILPEWDKKIRGVHTLNVTEDLTVIDIYEKKLKFLKWLR